VAGVTICIACRQFGQTLESNTQTSRSIDEGAAVQGGPLEHRELMLERENFGASSSRERIVVRSAASRAMNSAVILAGNGISLWSATATASTGTEYSVGTGRRSGAGARARGRLGRFPSCSTR